MQLSQLLQPSQLTSFEAAMIRPSSCNAQEAPVSLLTEETGPFSELSLRSDTGQCLSCSHPFSRAEPGGRRTLADLGHAPNNLSQGWLREAGLNRERILLLQPS